MTGLRRDPRRLKLCETNSPGEIWPQGLKPGEASGRSPSVGFRFVCGLLRSTPPILASGLLTAKSPSRSTQAYKQPWLAPLGAFWWGLLSLRIVSRSILTVLALVQGTFSTSVHETLPRGSVRLFPKRQTCPGPDLHNARKLGWMPRCSKTAVSE